MSLVNNWINWCDASSYLLEHIALLVYIGIVVTYSNERYSKLWEHPKSREANNARQPKVKLLKIVVV